MQNEDDLRGLAKIMEFMRAVSILFGIIHIYWFCYRSIKQWGIDIETVDKILLNFQHTTGLFSSVLWTKLFVVLFLALSCLGTQGILSEKITWRHIRPCLFAGLILFFLNWRILALPLPVTANSILYIFTPTAGYIFLLVAGLWISRLLKHNLMEDVFNNENESFMQETRKMVNEYSVNLPTKFWHQKRQHDGWINVVNPFRASLVLGTPGSGKSFAIVNNYIKQQIEKGFAIYIYDYKFPDLSEIAYNHLLNHRTGYRIQPKFYVINFDDPHKSHRCNPIAPEFMTDISDAYTTRYGNVSGLGNPEGSQRALNLLYAIRTVQNRQNRDLCATFLSGTVISNSLVELYLIFKYLRPRALEAQGIRSFDAWAAVYARKTADYEFSVTNEIVRRDRFRYFIKVPELCNFYRQICDCRSSGEACPDRPALNPVLYGVPPTLDQQDFTKRLIEFARKGDGEIIGRPGLSESERKAKMLIATSYARKMSLDMRLIDPYYADHPQNKLSHCAAKIAEYYHRYHEHRGTQFFFCDTGTYKKGSGDFNLYTELKRKLVEDHHIPAHEIRFIQECGSVRDRKELFAAMNSGTVRVLMGSTVMLGTGVNAQRRAVAVHHFDIPWKPSEMEQCNGRAARPGNVIAGEFAGNTVDCFIYATENTLDTYKFNILQNKQMFITQMKRGSLGVRTIDEGAADEGGAMNFAEYVAVMSGNSDLMEKAKLEKAVMALESERRSFLCSRTDTEKKMESTRRRLETERKTLAGFLDDLAYLNTVAPADGKGKRPNPVILDGLDASSEGDAGIRLMEIDRTAETGGRNVRIGTLFRFSLAVRTVSGFKDERCNLFYVTGTNGYEYSRHSGRPAGTPETAARYFISALERLPRLIEQSENEIRQYENDLPVLQKILDSPWDNAPKLQRLKSELDALDRKIRTSLEFIGEEQEPCENHGK